MNTPATRISPAMQARLHKRHRAERRFKAYGISAIALALLMLCVLLYSIIAPGVSGFVQHQVRVEITQSLLNQAKGNEQKLVVSALRAHFPELASTRERLLLGKLLSASASFAWRESDSQPLPAPLWVPLSDAADQYLKGRNVATLNAEQKDWLDTLAARGDVAARFNRNFFTHGDSREPDQAGFLGSLIGSLLTLAICMISALGVGILAAIYLQECAPKNRLTDLIEVNINNLAAVPSIIFGLLGLSVFLNWMGLPRSSTIVGGLTLALMILPVIIISARVSLAAVPPSVRDAARGLGASPMQVVWHHVVPYALPGMMTGAILGLARAIGETAPLLMIGMVAFIADVPAGFSDAATVMPVQIYLWASSPEMGFVEKTSTGIIVLLGLLVLMNLAAIWVRRRFEIRW